MSEYRHVYESQEWRVFRQEMASRPDHERPYIEFELEEKNLTNYFAAKDSSPFYQALNGLRIFTRFQMRVLEEALRAVHEDNYSLGQLREMAKLGPKGFKKVFGIGPERAICLYQLFKED